MFFKYVIKNDDTLESIANQFVTTKELLKSINNIPFDDMIRAGSELIIPKNKNKYFMIYKINEGDTIYGIARKYNINPELLASMNGLNMNDYIYPNQEILIPQANYSYYITKEGDTLNSISKTFNTSIGDILNDNDVIYLLEGQIIVKNKK